MTHTVITIIHHSAVLNINSNIDSFCVIHNNIRSLNKNLDEFKIFIHDISPNIDCIILTETWKLDDPSLYNIDGYNMIYNFGELNQNDGVVAYLKHDLEYTYQITKLNRTMKLLDIKIKTKSKKCYKCSSYLQSIKFQKTEYYLLIGDINIDILQINDVSTEYINTLCEFGYTSAINGATRVEKNNKTCIDHIFIKPKNDNIDYCIPLIIKTDITDHYTTMIQIILSNNILENEQHRNQTFIQQIDNQNLANILSNTSWETVYTTPNVESATNMFINIITQAVANSTIEKKAKRKYTKKTPWITNALLKSVSTKNKMFKTLQNNPNNEDLKIEYRNYRNKLTNLIKKYLGLVIDKHLKWNLHIQFVIKKLQFILHKFKLLCNTLGQDILRTVYYALVESHLKYAILAWGAAAKSHIKPLEILQKKFLKLIDLLYTEAKICDIRQLFFYNCTYKYHKTRSGPILPRHEYGTRNRFQFTVPMMTKTTGQRSYNYLGPKLYNTIPEELKQINNKSIKYKLKSFILTLPREICHNYIENKMN
ncbi:hypothetical protein NQ318_014637 [Aromia moschata]|uniref:Reverse transcriptase domain-containing protein n=1 Tax=Aromia moschata TaxID=1265417 RepID=A0AAV8ZBR6_9CUCU|nr:hypothetical protein NQ318_014637 [Aromia moschata]